MPIFAPYAVFLTLRSSPAANRQADHSGKQSQKYCHVHSLKGFRPEHPTKSGRTYRTDRPLPKPDISSAAEKD